jgi:hypothetical protein
MVEEFTSSTGIAGFELSLSRLAVRPEKDAPSNILFYLLKENDRTTKGIIPFKGIIANVTLYKSKEGFMGREKDSLDA